jgi:stage II sporulation protein Q
MVKMKRRKFKAFVLPTLYVLIVGVICLSVGLISKNLNQKKSDIDYSVNSITNDNITPVIKETETPVTTKPVAPYTAQNVALNKDFYSKDDDQKTQENSLIFYQNTYLENTGILYTSSDAFDIVASLDGTVKSIKDDAFLGKVVEISHNNNLSTFYYSLSEVTVKEGDTIKSGSIIGKSGENKIENKEGTSLLFEVYYKGKAMDPETFYTTDSSQLQ